MPERFMIGSHAFLRTWASVAHGFSVDEFSQTRC